MSGADQLERSMNALSLQPRHVDQGVQHIAEPLLSIEKAMEEFVRFVRAVRRVAPTSSVIAGALNIFFSGDAHIDQTQWEDQIMQEFLKSPATQNLQDARVVFIAIANCHDFLDLPKDLPWSFQFAYQHAVFFQNNHVRCTHFLQENAQALLKHFFSPKPWGMGLMSNFLCKYTAFKSFWDSPGRQWLNAIVPFEQEHRLAEISVLLHDQVVIPRVVAYIQQLRQILSLTPAHSDQDVVDALLLCGSIVRSIKNDLTVMEDALLSIVDLNIKSICSPALELQAPLSIQNCACIARKMALAPPVPLEQKLECFWPLIQNTPCQIQRILACLTIFCDGRIHFKIDDAEMDLISNDALDACGCWDAMPKRVAIEYLFDFMLSELPLDVGMEKCAEICFIAEGDGILRSHWYRYMTILRFFDKKGAILLAGGSGVKERNPNAVYAAVAPFLNVSDAQCYLDCIRQGIALAPDDAQGIAQNSLDLGVITEKIQAHVKGIQSVMADLLPRDVILSRKISAMLNEAQHNRPNGLYEILYEEEAAVLSEFAYGFLNGMDIARKIECLVDIFRYQRSNDRLLRICMNCACFYHDVIFADDLPKVCLTGNDFKDSVFQRLIVDPDIQNIPNLSDAEIHKAFVAIWSYCTKVATKPNCVQELLELVQAAPNQAPVPPERARALCLQYSKSYMWHPRGVFTGILAHYCATAVLMHNGGAEWLPRLYAFQDDQNLSQFLIFERIREMLRYIHLVRNITFADTSTSNKQLAQNCQEYVELARNMLSRTHIFCNAIQRATPTEWA